MICLLGVWHLGITWGGNVGIDYCCYFTLSGENEIGLLSSFLHPVLQYTLSPYQFSSNVKQCSFATLLLDLC